MRRLGTTMMMALLAGCASKPTPGPTSQPAGHAHGEGHHEHGHDEGHDHAQHRSDHMEHSFEDPEYWSKRFDAPERDAWQKPAEVIALLDLEPGMQVADIGAGTGYFLPHLSPAVGDGGTVWALDVEPTLVEHMEKRAQQEQLGNVRAKVVEKDDPQLEPRSLDRILIVDTWHHIPDRRAYGRKLFEGLAPGGALYVVDFTMDSPSGPPKKHRILPETVANTLRAAGFEADVLEEELPRQYVVRGRRPLED